MCATSRAFRRWSKKFLARTYEDRQLLRRAEPAQRNPDGGIISGGRVVAQGLKRDEDVRPEELIVLAIVIGFPIALVIAWALELTACSKQLR